jgi:hypothetical protein
MHLSLRLFLLFVPLTFLLPTAPAYAQRGQLIEDLFRTIAEAQLEREKLKRAEAAAQANAPVPPDNLQPVPVPGSIFPTNPGGQVAPVNPDRSRPHGSVLGDPRGGAINVRSREAAEFANNLVTFSEAIDPLVRDMRGAAAQNAGIRELMPEAFQVATDARALLQRCDGLSTFEPIMAPYADLDSRWRTLSFRLRSLGGLSSQCTDSVRACDKLVSMMARQLNMQPQFDRHELHDLMIVAATHMVSLLDDLEMAQLNPNELNRFTHDCRLLRQRLLQEADRVEETSYEEVVTRFTDFANRWGAFSQAVYALQDPYLQRRLDRIRECGDQTYALLWMPPPYNATSLTASANRLQQATAELLDQMTIRAMVALSPQEQVQVLEASRRMYRQCEELSKATAQNAPRAALVGLFGQIDKDWQFLRSACYRMPAIKQGTLVAIDHECDRIRGALGVAPGQGQSIRYEELIQLAASLEGSAEYFDADIQRYRNYLQPNAYRESIVSASAEFLLHARQLHAKLSARADLPALQVEAEHMLDGWEQLSRDLSDVERHGLSTNRARSLQQARTDLVPVVAQVAAALVNR